MMLSRRRFLTLTAAATLAAPARAAPIRWQGFAMGAECQLTLHAPPEQARAAIARIRAMLTRTEALFSLYDPTSQLSRLNRTGHLRRPPPEMTQILAQANRVHGATQGRFDPTVQPLWQALARNHDPAPARARIGWQHVRRQPDQITLAPGQALTLNGIAQGFATDRARDILRQMGLTRVLINMGEFAALGGAFRMGLSDPARGLFATQPLQDQAMATSSPGALSLGAQSHILDPTGQGPLWSTVTVTGRSATLADAASTAFCLMTRSQIATALDSLPELTQVTMLPATGPAQQIRRPQ